MAEPGDEPSGDDDAAESVASPDADLSQKDEIAASHSGELPLQQGESE
jgi:hypothetical protein